MPVGRVEAAQILLELILKGVFLNREGAKAECTIGVVLAALCNSNREKSVLVEEVDVKILFFKYIYIFLDVWEIL